MQFITLDFETYYDSEFSLTKLTTEEYVRDDRFEIIGVGVKVNDEVTQFYSAPLDTLKSVLTEKYDWANSICIAHNAQFDAAILTWKLGIKPYFWVDTLSLARAIDGLEVSGSLKVAAERHGLGVKGTEVLNAKGKRRADFSRDELQKYGSYCINDVDLTWRLYWVYEPRVSSTELEVINITTKMFSEPALELDLPLLEQHLEEVKDRKEQLLNGLGFHPGLLASNPQFAEVLRSLGVTPPTKISATTGKSTYAFAKSDEGFKALLEHDDPKIQALAAARAGIKSTLEETRTERFIQIAKRGPLPVPLKYYAAHTGRWGGCLIADTEVSVYDPLQGYTVKRIVDVLPDDLVWDGEEFVPHEGVKFSGFQEVITWDGITGTPDHVVFTDAGEISLREAMQRSHRITVARSPNEDDVDSVVRITCKHEA